MSPAGHPIDLQALGICGMTADSRDVRPGYLFMAVPGGRTDGRAFIPDAIARGAKAILVPAGTAADMLPAGITVILDETPRRLFARLAARFFGVQPAKMVAVTGTSGKTSVVEFIRQLWRLLGLSAASLGTLGLIAPGLCRAGALTTPDPVALHHDLARLAEAGIDRVAMEASSHGLDQYRLDGVTVSTGVFTNLSRDHLDYHCDLESYLEAKLGLFRRVMPPGGFAVVNADDPAGPAVGEAARAAGHDVWRYGRRGPGLDIAIEHLEPTEAGQLVSFRLLGRHHRARMPFIGVFQAENALAALGAVAGGHDDPHAVVACLEGLRSVRGRLELAARAPSGAPVYVDYAHKPGALTAVLEALRPFVRGRLVLVFGAGGDRDTGKRAEMGAVAHRLADRTIVTDDNPRGEDPATIRAAIRAACPGAADIGDRKVAIATGMEGLGPDDALLIAGKGHEASQIVGTEVHAFDDRAVARQLAKQAA
ncbi:MAG: UDP-N-acetylmuramoyl-L-alanyl-D-glutamate--2,6-diaminopimelate ligase [Alphaproteobacteria bacterium]|nr:UDP-N-acetylmuramoyl-L-alanyl-D-glutamate--2,6-diaminopimelate ligase [Alphaproteobacteria bacterium]MCY4318956.1 UDP-N-acetylmuramoyl-L-alanyl-D-glutamate--2,6-diaminopimelate ligase [Alphaproteobacteria bacterium]